MRKRRRLRASVVNTGHAESLDRRRLAGFCWRRRPSDREPGDARDSRRSRRSRRPRTCAAHVQRQPPQPGNGAGCRRSNAAGSCTKRQVSCAADRAELSKLLTLEGGKPRIENLDEVEWSAACFQVLRRDRPQLARLVHPANGRTPNQLHDQGTARRRRRDRAVQLPAAAARLEDRAGARRRQHGRHQALRADTPCDAPDGRAGAGASAPRGRQRRDRRPVDGSGAGRAIRTSPALRSPDRRRSGPESPSARPRS